MAAFSRYKKFERPQITEGTITALKTQIRDPKRVSVYIDGSFVCGMHLFKMQDLGLHKGLKVSPTMAETLAEAVESDKIWTYLLRLLERREHASRELLQKAQQKGFSTPLIEQNLIKLQESGLQSDSRYCEQLIRSKKRSGWGPLKIRMYLIKNGIKQQLLKSFEADLRPLPEDELQNMQQLISKKAKSWSTLPALKQKERIYRHLLQKGFEGATIMKYMNSFLKSLESTNRFS